MTTFNDTVAKAKLTFPNLTILYKDRVWWMKILGKILFFNPGFMDSYVTTIGQTMYFPSEVYTKTYPISSIVVFAHELVHVSDEASKLHSLWYGFLYSLPQSLFLLAFPVLFFLLSWKFALLSLILLLPLPAYFRKNDEQKAYSLQLYAMHVLNTKYNYNINLETKAAFCADQFRNSYYYFMWIFNMNNYFLDYVMKVQSGQKPDNYEPEIYALIDGIL